MADKQLRVIIVGDASSVQRAFKQTDEAAGQTQVKLEGFGAAFGEAGLAAGLGAAAATAGIELVHKAAEGLASAVIDYNASIEQAEARVRGFTGSQRAVADAMALARKEADAGRGTYVDLLNAIADLTPLARSANVPMQDLLRTAQLLAAADPAQGFEGAAIALREALSGDFTSLTRRFEIPRTEIQRMKDEGVPNIEIVRRSLVNLGIDEKLLTEQSKTFATQQALLTDNLQRLSAEGGKPIFDAATTSLIALNKALKEPVVAEFIDHLALGLQDILAGNLFEALGAAGLDAFLHLARGYDQFLDAVSGGRVRVSQAVLGALQDAYDQMDAEMAANRDRLFKPVAEGLSGQSGPLATNAVQGWGRNLANQYLTGILAGLTADQRGAFDQISKLTEGLFKDSEGKTNTDALAGASLTLAQAFKEINEQGQITYTTLRDLRESYGEHAGEVLGLVRAYQALTNAQEAATVAQQKAAAGQAGVNVAIASGDVIIAGYTQRLDEATRAAEQHGRAHQGVVDALGRESADVQRAADARQRELQDETAALQDQAAAQQDAAQAHAAASAASVAGAQADLKATQDRAAAHSGLLTAALRGETEEYLKQLDVIDDQTRAIADRYEAEIGGIRRARDAANQQVANLTRAQNRETLDFLTRIDAARKSGNERQARALEREMAARQQSHQSQNALARARAAVAGDEFDAASEHLTKEAQAQAEQDKQATTAAEKRLGEVQSQAEAQRAADDAALRAIQDQIAEVNRKAQADQRASLDKQRAIQDEIDKENARYSIIAAGDRDAAAMLSALIGDRKTYWAQETTQLGITAKYWTDQATNAERTATAMQKVFENLRDIDQLKFENLPASLGGQKVPPPATPGPGIVPGGSFTQPRVPGDGAGGGGNGALSGYDIWQDVVRGGTSTVRG